MAKEEAKAEVKEEPVAEKVMLVRFLGSPGIRLISHDDWEAAGVKDHADTYWNQANDWTVKQGDLGLNDEQFARIILMDTGFRVERAEAEAEAEA